MPEHRVIDHRDIASEAQTLGTQTAAVSSGRRAGQYLFWLIAVTAVLYLLPFALVRLPGYIRLAGSLDSPAVDYSFTTAGQNADIVIFGESSAFEGIAPVEVSKDLGLKTINLPNTIGTLLVVDDLSLRYYLSVNRPPKLIVVYLAPWALDYLKSDSRFLYVGEEMLFRHGSAKEIAAFALKRPIETLQWPLRAYSAGPKAAIIAALRHENRSAAIAKTMGHQVSSATTVSGLRAVPNLKSPCTLPAKDFGRDFSSVQSLVSRLTQTTKVLVFLAPIPGCDNAAGIVERSYAGVSAAPPKVMPPTVFRDDAAYIHLDPVAVPAADASLEAAVKQALAGPNPRQSQSLPTAR